MTGKEFDLNLIANMNATDKQREVASKLIAKGYLEPWKYKNCIRLGLPDVWHLRNRGARFRDYRRPGVRVTPTGRILANAVRKEDDR